MMNGKKNYKKINQTVFSKRRGCWRGQRTREVIEDKRSGIR